MRHFREFQGLAQLLPLSQTLDRATVVGAEELPKHEQGEQLGLSELLGTARVRIGCQGFLAGRQRFPRQRDG